MKKETFECSALLILLNTYAKSQKDAKQKNTITEVAKKQNKINTAP